MEIFVLKPLVVGKLRLFSGMWNYALMHCEGLKGFKRRGSVTQEMRRLWAHTIQQAHQLIQDRSACTIFPKSTWFIYLYAGLMLANRLRRWHSIEQHRAIFVFAGSYVQMMAWDRWCAAGGLSWQATSPKNIHSHTPTKRSMCTWHHPYLIGPIMESIVRGVTKSTPPANTRHWPIVGSMLGQRRRRVCWAASSVMLQR